MKDGARVYLVGAGPGDPELLTLKARRLLDAADVVVYDRLVSPGVLDMIPPGRARIFVGKAAGRHPVPQEDINEILVNLARTGHTVVRLKGGDPFIFGRGSEEALHLARHGIPFEVVPGITAASGVSAALGVPLTHRGMAAGVRLVTGHCRSDVELDLDWQGLADPDTTLVFYMGKANVGQIAERLIAAGLVPDTPAAAVSAGTMPGQRQCATTLERLPALIDELAFGSPILFVIGQVVDLAQLLNWQDVVYEDGAADPEAAAEGLSAHA